MWVWHGEVVCAWPVLPSVAAPALAAACLMCVMHCLCAERLLHCPLQLPDAREVENKLVMLLDFDK